MGTRRISWLVFEEPDRVHRDDPGVEGSGEVRCPDDGTLGVLGPVDTDHNRLLHGIGTTHSSSVPFLSAGLRPYRPPSFVARAAMLARPLPPPSSLPDTSPTPLSATLRERLRSTTMLTRVVVAWAWRATLDSASRRTASTCSPSSERRYP